MSQISLEEKYSIPKGTKLEMLKMGRFRILKPDFTKLTSGMLKGKHISSEEILSEYESAGGRH